MLISITGFDGVGKSTSVELIRKKICDCFHLKGISAKSTNADSMIYQTVNDLNAIFQRLSEYDVISCPFYFRTLEFQRLQNELMFSNGDVFSDTELILKIAKLSREMAEMWFEHVINKLNSKGKIIIFDRYYYDEIAYRSLYNLNSEHIEELYKGFYDSDIRVFLQADMETILLRNKNRDDTKGALFQRQDKMKELLENLEWLCEKYLMSTVRIKNKTKEEVTDEIYAIIEPSVV